jgi:glucose-6-phosphate isomerase
MELQFGTHIRSPDIRRLFDMKEVIYDRPWLQGSIDTDLYFMYRDLYLSRADRDRLVDSDLRYDITVIPPGMIGCEYVKTAGHYHPVVPGTDVTYPEIYEVLEGKAIYLLQTLSASDVVAVSASPGDKVIIPPGYGHVTINASNKRLKMANFVARSFSSIYEPVKTMGGAAYFLTTKGYVRNDRYLNASPLRSVLPPGRSILSKVGLSRSKEMYPSLRDSGLGFLTSPQDHLDLFEGLLG